MLIEAPFWMLEINRIFQDNLIRCLVIPKGLFWSMFYFAFFLPENVLFNKCHEQTE